MAWTRLAVRPLRAVGFFVAHFLAASIGTKIFEEELSHVFHASTLGEMLRREYVVSVIIALALGYFVYYKWHSASGKWVWIAGALFFVYRAVSIWHTPHSVLTSAPSFGTVCLDMFRPIYRTDSIVYTLTLVRTVSYSIGAWACWCAEGYLRGHRSLKT